MRDSDEFNYKIDFYKEEWKQVILASALDTLLGLNFKLNGTWMEQALTGFEQRGLGLLIDNWCKFQCGSNLSCESQTPAQCDTLHPQAPQLSSDSLRPGIAALRAVSCE